MSRQAVGGFLDRTGSSHRWLWALGVAWWLAMVALPIARWTLGDAATPAALSVAVVAQALLVAALAARAWGLRETGRAFALVAALGWCAEWIGSRSGLPFGSYDYTGRLQPALGEVPLAVPLSWWMMIVPAWAVAEAVVGSRGSADADGGAVGDGGDGGRGAPRRRRASLLFAIVAGFAITAWDLFLDPQMVAWGMWRWEAFEGAGYFGIPWLNYGGWWLVAGLMTMMVRPRPLGAATVPLLWVYGLVAALEAGGLGLFWGLPGPALSGLAGMGACLGLALWRRSAAAKAEARA